MKNLRERAKTVLACLFFLLIVYAVLAFKPAHAGTVKLEYIPPTTCAGGEALTNCPTTGFEILLGSDVTGTYTSLETVAPTVVSRTYQNVVPGKRCHSIRTVSNGAKSEESTRACVDVPSLPPKAPSGIQVTVVVTVTTPP